MLMGVLRSIPHLASASRWARSVRSVALAACMALPAAPAAAQSVADYYTPADGTKGEALKTALSAIIADHTVRSYGDLWKDFQTTDRRSDGCVWDMYSNITNYVFVADQAGSFSKEGQKYNREHSFPKSWWGGSSSLPSYTDLFHLYPTDGYVNGMRANYPFGEVKTVQKQSAGGFSKLGSCSVAGYPGSAPVFEPADEYKGDFARTYFYMATAYEPYFAEWATTEGGIMLDGTSYPGFRTWAIDMLLKWAADDPVSEKETARNEAVFSIQHNRNPFIDFPGLEQYVWGELQDVAFNAAAYRRPTSLIAAPAPGVQAPAPVLYDLSGRRIQRGQQHGVGIANGQKVIW